MKKLLFFVFSLFLITEVDAASLTLSSTFSNNAIFPQKYTCDAGDKSPELAWQNVPTGTKTFALVFYDPDAPTGTWYHWIVYNLPQNSSQLPEGITQLPSGAQIAKNSWGKSMYNGPCPPAGTEHHYVFVLYALNTSLPFSAGADTSVILEAMKPHILQQAILTGVYKKK